MYQLAASIMCADQMNLKKELVELEKTDIKLLHCDVMDGVFVNNLAMGPYVLEQIKANTKMILVNIKFQSKKREGLVKMMTNSIIAK